MNRILRSGAFHPLLEQTPISHSRWREVAARALGGSRVHGLEPQRQEGGWPHGRAPDTLIRNPMPKSAYALAGVGGQPGCSDPKRWSKSNRPDRGVTWPT